MLAAQEGLCSMELVRNYVRGLKLRNITALTNVLLLQLDEPDGIVKELGRDAEASQPIS
jgi:hypothetical protein